MHTKKFTFVCLIVSVLAWLFYLSETVHSWIFAPIFALVAVVLGVLVQKLIKGKDGETVKIGGKGVFHIILTFLSLTAVFYTFSVFTDPAYGYYSFGSGKYGYEISFWDVGEILPDAAYLWGRNLLPLLTVIFAVWCRPLAFCTAGTMAWINIRSINTSKVFGSYTIVSAAGNDSVRETTVYNFSGEVTTALSVLVAVLFLLALLDLIVLWRKSKLWNILLIIAMLWGAAATYLGYNAYTTADTYDMQALKDRIYVETKDGSENYRAENFNNEFGSIDTPCAYPGCSRTIVTSGDSNCCSVHSNRCLNCSRYIDGDAVYCMRCIEEAVN